MSKKAQASVESLTSFGMFLAIIIPLSLLFITLSSINSESLQSKMLENSIRSLSNEIGTTFLLCNEKELSRKISLRIPENVEKIDFQEDPSINEVYLRFDLKDGSSILNKLTIPCNSLISGKCTTSNNGLISLTSNLPNDYNGNTGFEIKCKEVAGTYYLSLEGNR